jgi:hypothetical protein
MDISPPFLLLADIGDVIGSIVGIIFLVVWVIGQLSGAKKEAKPPQPRQPAAPPQPPARQQPAQRAQPVGGGQADPLRDQVEEFLRRAGRQQKPDAGKAAPVQGGRAAPAAGRRGQPPREEIEILLEEVPAERQRRPLSKPLRPAEKPAAKSRPLPPRGGKKSRRESLAEHADQVEASARSMVEHSSKLGQTVVDADQQFDARLAARLDHRVGTLDEQHAQRMQDELPVAAVATPASNIAAMLTNPEGIRQAIILNEILRRPADRWE